MPLFPLTHVESISSQSLMHKVETVTEHIWSVLHGFFQPLFFFKNQICRPQQEMKFLFTLMQAVKAKHPHETSAFAFVHAGLQTLSQSSQPSNRLCHSPKKQSNASLDSWLFNEPQRLHIILLRWFIAQLMAINTFSCLQSCWWLGVELKVFTHSWKLLFAFRFCSFLHMSSPLARVEFNRLVSSGLQILDSRGSLCPPEEELPSWVSPNQTLPACLVLSVCQPVLLPLQTGKPKGSFFFFFNLTPQFQPAAVMKDSSYWLVCWPCGLFSECVGFRQHTFWHTHTRWTPCV